MGRSAAYSPDRHMEYKDKRYKLSFYDCISLYCGARVGIDRGRCIVKFCHRT